MENGGFGTDLVFGVNRTDGEWDEFRPNCLLWVQIQLLELDLFSRNRLLSPDQASKAPKIPVSIEIVAGHQTAPLLLIFVTRSLWIQAGSGASQTRTKTAQKRTSVVLDKYCTNHRTLENTTLIAPFVSGVGRRGDRSLVLQRGQTSWHCH